MGKATHIWLVGNGGFYNRGCEAIHRATIDLLAEEIGPCRFTAWSPDYTNDSVQGKQPSVRWRPNHCKGWLWGPCSPWRAKLPFLKRLPSGPLRDRGAALLSTPDCVLSLGGDNFSLDYHMPGLHVSQCEYFMRHNIPTVIWSATVGPFTTDPAYESEMAEFLHRVSLITVRESGTLDYLGSLGVRDNVVRVYDVAFALGAEEYDGPGVDFLCSGNVVGLNVSELLMKWYGRGDREVFLGEIAGFVRRLVREGHRVVLVPHVTRPGGPLVLNDAEFLRQVYEHTNGASERVALLPGNIPARQLKWAISRCRFFVGARTHATIAAVSSGVPTIAIAYSAKARGIWQDIFGHADYLLDTARVSSETLIERMQLLRDGETMIRKTLTEKSKEMRDGAKMNAIALSRTLRR